MEEDAHSHVHRPHGTGFRWLDISLALSAFVVVVHAVYLSLQNTGIGPARLRSIELSFAGKPAADLRELLALCCTQEPAATLPKTNYRFTGDMRGAMIQAGKSLNLFAWAQADADPRWARLERLHGEIDMRVCYCSVFDECYLRDSAQREPVRIRTCPIPARPYTGG